MSEELRGLESEYLEIRKRNAVLATDEGGQSFIARRLDQWDAAINQAMVRSAQLRSQIKLGKVLGERGVGLSGIAYALGQLSGDANQSLAITASGAGRSQALASDYVRQLINEQQAMADRYGAQYSKVQEIEEQIARVQRVAADSRKSVESVEVSDLISAIEEALTAVEELRAEYRASFASDLEQARQILNDRAEEEALRERLDRQQRLFNTIVDQLKQAQLVGEYSGVVTQTIEPPHALRRAVRPRVLLTLLLALLGGGVLGAAAALAADGLDSRLRSLDELRTILDARVLGVIPRLSKAELAEVDEPGLVVHQRPGSLAAEAYRGLRTGLEFARRPLDARVLLVCSPSPADGKSTVSSNLAVGLAQAGRRVLLIDGDLRKPSQDRIHNLRRDPGLSQVLRDAIDWRAAAQSTAVPGLDLMPTGPAVENPAELLMSGRFGSLVDELRRAYDLVLIDTSPLLYVADPTIVAPSADGIVLVVRPSELKRAAAERVAEVLQMMGTPVLGAVVNADEADGTDFLHAGRYYGRYGRTYGAADGSGAAGRSPTVDPASWLPAGLLRRFRSWEAPGTNGRPPGPPHDDRRNGHANGRAAHGDGRHD